MTLQIYRAARRKVGGAAKTGQTGELVRLIKAADLANRVAYDGLRNSGVDQEAADILLSAAYLDHHPAHDPKKTISSL
jgi:hypothetical protein